MNALPKTPCRKCGVATANRTFYCDAHAQFAFGWATRQLGKTTTQRGYGAAWRKLAKLIMRRDKVCQPCLKQGFYTPATEVDHITPRAAGGLDTPENLQAICKACHKAKTAREGRGC